jgi:hypothetical protein
MARLTENELKIRAYDNTVKWLMRAIHNFEELNLNPYSSMIEFTNAAVVSKMRVVLDSLTDLKEYERKVYNND